MAVATYIPEAPKQHNGDQLPAISGYSRAVTLGNLTGTVDDAYFIRIENSLRKGGGGRIHHVNYRNFEKCALQSYYAACSGNSLRTSFL